MSENSARIKILCVDDHPIVRQGIAGLLAAEADMALVADAANGREAIAQFRAHRPDITLVDRSPIASPKANSICERAIGTIRRECLDWVIPLSEVHLLPILKAWVEHYNRGRPHSRLGPGVPGPPRGGAVVPKSKDRHRLAAGALVLVKPVLGGLHHE